MISDYINGPTHGLADTHRIRGGLDGQSAFWKSYICVRVQPIRFTLGHASNLALCLCTKGGDQDTTAQHHKARGDRCGCTVLSITISFGSGDMGSKLGYTHGAS